MALRLANQVKDGQHVQLSSKLLTQFMTTIKCCGMYAVGDPRAVENYMRIAEGVDYVMSKVANHRRATLMSTGGYANNNNNNNNNGGMGTFSYQGQVDVVAGAQASTGRGTSTSNFNGNNSNGPRSASRSTNSSRRGTQYSVPFNLNANNSSGSRGSQHLSYASAPNMFS
jgi:hypothetical protein